MALTPATSAQRFDGGTITGTLAIQPTVAAGNLGEALSVVPPAGYTGGILDIADSNFDSVLVVAADTGQSAAVAVQPQVDHIGVLVAPAVDLTHDVLRVNTRTVAGIAVDQNGAFRITGGHAAPADGDLAAGQLALWFDQTNGAAKLMVKAKSANGTVATASVALA